MTYEYFPALWDLKNFSFPLVLLSMPTKGPHTAAKRALAFVEGQARPQGGIGTWSDRGADQRTLFVGGGTGGFRLGVTCQVVGR